MSFAVWFPDGHGSNEDGSAQCCTVTEPVPPSRPVPRFQSRPWFWPCWHEPARSTDCCATSKDLMTAYCNDEINLTAEGFAKRGRGEVWERMKFKHIFSQMWKTCRVTVSEDVNRHQLWKWWILINILIDWTVIRVLAHNSWPLWEMDDKSFKTNYFHFWQSSLVHYFTLWVSKRRKFKEIGNKVLVTQMCSWWNLKASDVSNC